MNGWRSSPATRRWSRSTPGKPFPQDVHEQLWGAIGAVFQSWMSARAITYRKLHNIPEDWGTAVNVQAMVFGNLGETSATGVAFTRNPSTGEKALYGEFLVNAQGEDVVAGIRTPQNITENGAPRGRLDGTVARSADARNLQRARAPPLRQLERHYRDMQDLEFTIQDGKLWMLQTRTGKRTARAALKIAVDMASEGLITREDAVMRIDPASLDQLLHPTLDPKAKREVIATGLPASPGAASGEIVFDSDEAERLKAMDRRVILVRIETSPEDIHGMHAAEGILTTRGGMTSHAAVVARGMGKPCVSGAGALRIDYRSRHPQRRGRQSEKRRYRHHRRLDRPGHQGRGRHHQAGALRRFRHAHGMGRCGPPHEGARQCRNAARCPGRPRIRRRRHRPLPHRAHVLRGRPHRAVREMILAGKEPEPARGTRQDPAHAARRFHRALFEIMAGLPVTIRLLDPPLHEFLPQADARDRGSGRRHERRCRRSCGPASPNCTSSIRCSAIAACSLAISYPEIAEMQARAIFEAAVEVGRRTGKAPIPEVMVPLVAAKAELDHRPRSHRRGRRGGRRTKPVSRSIISSAP